MVRLLLPIYVEPNIHEDTCHFNSVMVRLLPGLAEVQPQLIIMCFHKFQFRNGKALTQRTECGHSQQSASCGFNSVMVRLLLEYAFNIPTQDLEGFNSVMVRLLQEQTSNLEKQFK